MNTNRPNNKEERVVVLIGCGLLLFSLFIFRVVSVSAATNISATTTDHWAWNDVIGWIDFYNGGNSGVVVGVQRLTGSASSSVGQISLDCATSPNGNICATSNYAVYNDGLGDLYGWGWNDTYGWISFCGGHGSDPDPTFAANCPGSIAYRVLIDPNNGNFSQYAWNDAIGWVSFNCSNSGGCGTSNYKVNTAWVATSTTGTLDSSTFDTGISGGAQINSVVWHGTLPSPVNNAAVSFQLAGSNSSTGPWSYVGYDGTGNTWYTGGPNVAITTDYSLHNNERYFRYRVKLTSTQAQSASPVVNDININWSR